MSCFESFDSDDSQGRVIEGGGAMQIHILEEAGQGLATIDKSVRRRELEIPRAQPVEPIERLYMFAGWTLDETTRDLISPTGQRVDLTSSEFDLLMAFVRHPGQPLSRAALLGVLRGRQWTYFDRSIDTAADAATRSVRWRGLVAQHATLGGKCRRLSRQSD
jgi:hypothetical protein